MNRKGRRNAKVWPRGVLLLSPPGCGKIAFCKRLGNETGRPTLVLDVNSLMGSLVGQSETQTRQALKIANMMMAPCVLFLDEVEKALSGAASNGLRRLGPHVWQRADLAQRPRERCVRGSARPTTSRSCRPSSPEPSGSAACSSSTCRASKSGRQLVEAAKNVVPVARTSAESAERLRSWARGSMHNTSCRTAGRNAIPSRRH